MTATQHEVPAEKLRRTCDFGDLSFASTAEMPEQLEIIGQERATRAIEFGIDIPTYGYNIFAVGPSGTGKMTTVQRFLERKARTRPTPSDWCYVNNFADQDKPEAIELPYGRAAVFRQQMEQLVERIQQDLTEAFSSEQYEEHKSRLAREMERKRNQLLEEIKDFANEKGFGLVSTPGGLVVGIFQDGKVLSQEEYEKLPEERRKELEALRPEVQNELEKRFRKVRALDEEAKERLRDLDKEIAEFAMQHLFEELKTEHEHIADVQVFLGGVYEDVLEHLGLFKAAAQGGEAGEEAGRSPFLRQVAQPPYHRYRVNVLVDNSKTEGAPVIVENSPSCRRLVGRIEYRAEFGALVTDFSMIRAGALHRANGGYLVVDARKLLQDPSAWECLKRALRDRQIRLEEYAPTSGPLSTASLEPEPIPLDVKVVLTGDPQVYYLLYALDPEFAKLFKVKADFASEMDWEQENLLRYVRFIRARCEEEKLPHFSPEAVARVVEYGARLVEDQEKLSVRFALVSELVTEAGYWARLQGHELVQDGDVQRAVEEKKHRSSRVEERIREAMLKDTLMVDTEGAVVGQVNGLSVSSLGDYAFGRPSRITCQTYLGRAGIINIEREAKLSGRIHDKAVLILQGYLGGKYAQEHSLSLSASLCFEQSYEGVEGDSASSAEIFALLSRLADLPIKQSIAVTGSVNQRGEMQPVGGVNSKIEGFFDVCSARGLTGDQGVLIPQRNVRNLMLREDVVEAVRQGKFHIWAVDTVDAGISILTGVDAGERDESGDYPEGTVNARVCRKLAEYDRLLRRQKREEGPSEAQGEGDDETAPSSGAPVSRRR